MLRQVDPELADEVQRSSWDQGYQLLGYWGGLHLYYTETKTLLMLGEEIRKTLDQHLAKRFAIARPNPRMPATPVTRATLPAKSYMVLFS